MDDFAPNWTNADKEPSGGDAGPLFGPRPKPATPFDRGMEASEAAGARWSDAEVARIDDAIRVLAERCEPFTSDAIWALVPGVAVTKGIGARLRVAVNAGVIRSTGETRVADRGGDHDHAQRLSVWIGCGVRKADYP